MKKILLIFIALAFLPFISAITTLPNQLYVQVNTSYPVILLPLDENIWDIQLYTNGSQFNFTWTGTQYQLNLNFTAIGDYPFVINSTNVTGEITGTFLVRNVYYVSFQLLKSKTNPLPFMTNKYINNFGYVTAEYSNIANNPFNSYDPTLEKYFAPISFKADKYKKPVFSAQYINGKATLKLYEKETYAIRLIDGEMTFPYEYSIPNITESYGTNLYLGKFTFNGTNMDYVTYVSSSDLNPYGHLANWGLIILIVVTILGSVFLIFIIPQRPTIPIALGLGFITMLLIVRLILFIWARI